MPEIHLQNVGKTYSNGVRAVADLNLTIHDGELLVLVGPSGCGKSTTLRMIAGLEEPSAGEILIGGRSMHDVPPWQRNVAMVFQKPTLSPNRTVRANLNFANDMRRGLAGTLLGWLSSRTRAERRREEQVVAQVARLLDLRHVLDHKPAELSGGQFQRVALGRMLCRCLGDKATSDIIQLLDEPLGQLDGPLRRQLRRELHLLHRQFPATMIHVTHDWDEALALGDRIAVLHHGVLQQVDTAMALQSRPRYRFVAEFFPTTAGPMNFLQGRLLEEDGAPVLVMAHNVKLLCPPGKCEQWRKNLGRTVLVAVRPDDVCIQWEQIGAKYQPMQVMLLEPHLNGTLAICEAGNVRITALAHGKIAVGNEVFVEIRTDRSMLFAADTGMNLDLE